MIWIEGGNTLKGSVQTAPGVWSATPELIATSTGLSEPSVAMNNSGRIVVAWKEAGGIYASSRQVASPVWSAKVLLSTGDLNVDNPNVAINGAGLTYVVWQSTSGPNYLIRSASATTPPTFAAAQTVFSSVSPLLYPKVAVDETGGSEVAHVIFGSGSSIFSSFFDGAIWTAVPPQISTGTVELAPANMAIGVDNSGQAVAVWSLLASPGVHAIGGNFFSANTSTWGVATTLAGSSLQLMVPSFHLASSGDGILGYEIEPSAGTFIKQAAILPPDTTVFGPARTLATYSTSTGRPLVFTNEGGEAIASWLTPTNSLVAAAYPITPGVWNRFQTVATSVQTNIGVSIDSNDQGTAVFQTNSGAIFASTGADLLADFPFPPTNLRGVKNVEVRFLVQSAYNNNLFWDASPSTTVVTYNVYRNGILIGTVPATAPLQFTDQRVNRTVNYIYTVIAEDDAGLTSEAVSIIL